MLKVDHLVSVMEVSWQAPAMANYQSFVEEIYQLAPYQNRRTETARAACATRCATVC